MQVSFISLILKLLMVLSGVLQFNCHFSVERCPEMKLVEPSSSASCSLPELVFLQCAWWLSDRFYWLPLVDVFSCCVHVKVMFAE